MGVDLTILPVDYTNNGQRFCFSQLLFERRRDLWDEIQSKVVTRKIEHPIRCYLARSPDGEPCYGELLTDPYGDVLTVTTFEEFLRVLSHDGFKDSNVAIKAFIEAMPRLDEVVLYWH